MTFFFASRPAVSRGRRGGKVNEGRKLTEIAVRVSGWHVHYATLDGMLWCLTWQPAMRSFLYARLPPG